MASVLYCGVCTMPLEYCRYYPKYDKCLEWMKTNHPDIFQEEIKDIEDRNPKIAKKVQHLWDDSAPQPEMKARDNDDDNDNNNNQNQNQSQQPTKSKKKRGGKRNRNKGKGNNNNNNQNQQTKQVQIMESQVNEQQNMAEQNMNDIQGMLDKLSTSPSKGGILKNKNPNYAQEQQNLNDSQLNSGDEEDGDGLDDPQFLGAGGNRNKARGPPSRKDTKQRKRKKKNKRFRHKTNKDEEEEEDENKEKDEEEEETREQRQKRVKFEKMRNKKVPKNIVEVTLENRKGNKRVTIVRGFIEKSQDKEQRIKSEFCKKFATSCMITFQNQGSDKGPKQVVLMGDKRYDFMKYLKDKFPKAGKLLYYKTKRYGLTPAVDPEHGFVMPPP